MIGIPMSINTFEWSSLTEAGATQLLAMNLAFCDFYIKRSLEDWESSGSGLRGPGSSRDLWTAIADQKHEPLMQVFLLF